MVTLVNWGLRVLRHDAESIDIGGDISGSNTVSVALGSFSMLMMELFFVVVAYFVIELSGSPGTTDNVFLH